MNWNETIKLLQDNHIYPNVRKDLRSGDILWLEVDCAPILKDMRMEHIKKVLGEEYKLDYIPNDHEYILIKKIPNAL